MRCEFGVFFLLRLGLWQGLCREMQGRLFVRKQRSWSLLLLLWAPEEEAWFKGISYTLNLAITWEAFLTLIWTFCLTWWCNASVLGYMFWLWHLQFLDECTTKGQRFWPTLEPIHEQRHKIFMYMYPNEITSKLNQNIGYLTYRLGSYM